MVGTNDSTNENHKFYNSTLQAISRGGGDQTKKVGVLCSRFFNMGAPVKTQLDNGISKIFNLQGQTIDVSDQSVFTLNDLSLHNEERSKTNVNYLLTVGQRRTGRFLLVIMMVHLDQADKNCKNSILTFRECIKLPLDVDGIDASIDTQMLKTPHDLLLHLVALENGRNTDIGTLKKDRGDIFSECCAEIFKIIFLCYVNKVLFEMVKTALKDTYLGGKTPTALQNEVSACRKMYYDKETWVMVNQSVNNFYSQFLFKIDALTQDVSFPLDIAETLFKNLSNGVREFLISEGV